DDEAEPAELKEVIKVVNITKLMTEVVTTAATTITAAPMPTASAPRRRKGLQVKQKEDEIFRNQDKYVAKILRKFGLTDGKSASTPIDIEKTLLKDPDGEDINVHAYRPDTMFVVCACARFQVTPKASHLHAIKRIFSDYARASLDRKSTTKGCQFLGCRLISWQCKKQTIIATSSTEVEYVAATSCCAQVPWIRNHLLDYSFGLTMQVNKSNMKLLECTLHVINVSNAGYITTPQMVLNSPCLTHIKN
nr:hypothetical protein [Tanacetum cinerariifolium]